MKFLVMGLGSIGLRHAKNLLAMGHEVYGYDIDKRVLAGACERGVRWWEGDHDGCDIQYCLVATPTTCHAMDIARAAKRGWPTFVEKPIASSMKELENVDTSHVLMVGNMLRFHPHVIKAKAICEKDPPARGTFVISQFNQRPQYQRDGVMLNWLSHEIDLALHLMGPAKVVAACTNKEENIASVFLKHDSGACSTVYGDYLGEPEDRTFRLHCPTSHEVHMVDLVNSGYEYFPGKFRRYDLNETYIAEMQEFVDMVNGSPRQRIGASAEDGLKTLRIIDEARRITT